MFFFKKKYRLLDTGVFLNKTDIHSHLLPGVDDGSPNMVTTSELLDFMENTIGFRSIWFTPHVMEELMKNTPEILTEKFNEVREVYKGNMILNLASEYMLDSSFIKRLPRDILRLGKKHILIETSYMAPPNDMKSIIENIIDNGYIPLLAHPERYRYMNKNSYQYWIDSGCKLQLNFMSLSGYYGEGPKLASEYLLSERKYDNVGSDLHHLKYYKDMLLRLYMTSEQIDVFEELLYNNENL